MKEELQLAQNQLQFNGSNNPCQLGIINEELVPLQWVKQYDILGRPLNFLPMNELIIEVSLDGKTRKRVIAP